MADSGRRAGKQANHAWVSLKQRKAPRGNPEAAALNHWLITFRPRQTCVSHEKTQSISQILKCDSSKRLAGLWYLYTPIFVWICCLRAETFAKQRKTEINRHINHMMFLISGDCLQMFGQNFNTAYCCVTFKLKYTQKNFRDNFHCSISIILFFPKDDAREEKKRKVN